MARWRSGSCGAVEWTELPADAEEVARHIATALDAWVAPGGVVLLCLSAVGTRGDERIRRERALDGGGDFGEGLVAAPHGLCTADGGPPVGPPAGPPAGPICAKPVSQKQNGGED